MGEAKRKRRLQSIEAISASLPPGDIARKVTMLGFHWELAVAGLPIRITKLTEAFRDGEDCCAACNILIRLVEARMLPRFRAVWRGVCNCNVVVEAFCQDLSPLGDENPFAAMCGSSALLVTDRDPEGFHCWLEYDGWAIDAANGGGGNPIAIMPVDDYYAVNELTRIRRETRTVAAHARAAREP